MSLQQPHRPFRHARIESADDPINAGRGNRGLTVLIPVVCESFARWKGWLRFVVQRSRQGSGVNGNREHLVVFRTGRGPQIPEAEVTVRADGTEDAFCVGRPLDAVGAGMGREGENTLWPIWGPYLDRAIPGRGGECGLRREVPGAGKRLTRVFGEGRYGELGCQRGVVEPQRSVTGGGEQMVCVCFRVREIVESVLGRKPGSGVSSCRIPDSRTTTTRFTISNS